MNAKRIAIIGCGAAARKYYLPEFKKFPDISKNVISVDVNLDSAKYMAGEFGNTNFTSNYREVLGEVSGVIITVPPSLHYSIALEFLKNSTHVLCEKPIAETSSQVNDLNEEARKKNVKILVNNTRRLFPSHKTVKDYIEGNRLGEIKSIRYFEANKFGWESETPFYVYHKYSKQGVLLDLGSHVLDLICWWLGKKFNIVEYKDDSFGGPESLCYLKGETENCKIEVTLNRHLDLGNYFKIIGTQSQIIGSLNEWKSLNFVNLRNNSMKKIKLRSEVQNPPSLVKYIVENFVKILENNTIPLISANDVLSSIELIEECYRNRSRFNMPWYQEVERLISD